MFRPRVIPVLLLKDKGLVKSRRFRKPRYIGDPINAVKIFNDLQADELVFLDITASKERRTIPIDLVRNIGDEAFMPFAVGGGIRDVESAAELIKAGAEKVVINTAAVTTPTIVTEIARRFGSQSVIVSIDVNTNFLGSERVCIMGGMKWTSIDPVQHAVDVANAGAGEILINSIHRDGEGCGYDLHLVRRAADAVGIPVIACGGAGMIEHLVDAVQDGGASAAAAGSLFVFHGERQAVLINYPEQSELVQKFCASKLPKVTHANL